MTVQEAKKILQTEHLGDSESMELAKQMGAIALEKQIPKKPLTEIVNRGIDVSGEYDIDYNYLCPTCNSVVGNFETEDIWCDFCDNCGQAIDRTLDWSGRS